jgi:hypothetical protein
MGEIGQEIDMDFLGKKARKIAAGVAADVRSSIAEVVEMASKAKEETSRVTQQIDCVGSRSQAIRIAQSEGYTEHPTEEVSALEALTKLRAKLG